jgi:hypothetical protein
MEDWSPLPLNQPLYANLDADAVVGYQTAIENGYLNDMGGHSRFPGFSAFASLADNGRVYLNDWNDDLIASTSKGQVYRIDRQGNVENITGVPVSGGRRAIFAKTDTELHIAAGGPIIRLRGARTELLSKDAPDATHIGWIDGYSLAAEVQSGRFYHSDPNEPSVWDPLSTFAADGNPDNINSLIVTPFREILIGGPDSIEQFERAAQGSIPFFRRWSVGDGVSVPYAMIFADNAVWTVNNLSEVIRFSGQISEAVSSEIGRLMERIDDWNEGWIGGFPDRPLHIAGQKFILLQAPHATNAYGTKGVTLLLDYRNKRWCELYGWDADKGVPTRWPGWSHWTLWGKIFVGGEGRVYEMTPDAFTLAGGTQRWLVRTAHLAMGNQAHIKAFRLQIKRGIGSSSEAPDISVRCSRDGRPFGNRIRRSLGKAGQRLQMIEFGAFGIGSTFQFEISCSANCDIQLMRAEVKTDPVGH